MRISSFIIYDRITRGFQENLSRLFDSHEKLATGKRINRPSDDIIGMSRVMDYKLEISKNDQFLRNMDDATAFLEFADTIMDSVSESLIRLKELALTGVNGDENPESRQAIAKEVSEIKKALLSYSNSKLGDRYIFSGYKTDLPAFNSSFIYQGDNGKIKTSVNQTAQTIENISGTEGFAYTLSSAETIALNDGRYIHYIPDGNTQITVRITNSANPLDGYDQNDPATYEFRYSNFMEMAQVLEDALNGNNVDRIQAILKSLDDSLEQVSNVRAELGARLNTLFAERENNEDTTLSLRSVLSQREDADILEVTSELSKAEVALQALRNTGAKILSQSLFDFLR